MKRNVLATALTAAALALGSLTLTGIATAAETHDHGGHVPALTLDAAGQKWTTDAPLRQGMNGIRASVERVLPAVHAGELEPAGYTRLGGEVEDQLAYIVANCKLAPAADEVLHGILAEVGEGVAAINADKATEARTAGVVRLVDALDNYGRYFDHPEWTPVARGH